MTFKTYDYPSPPEPDEGPCVTCESWHPCPCECGMGWCSYNDDFRFEKDKGPCWSGDEPDGYDPSDGLEVWR